MDKKLKEFIIGAIIISLATVAGYLIAPIEVRFLYTLTNNSTLIGLTYAIGSILFGILSIWLGRLSDKFGRNRFIILGCLLGVIYPLLYASTYNIYQYMGVKFVWAFASVTTGPIFMAYLQDLLTHIKKQGQYIGIVFSLQSIFGAGAAFIGGYLSDKFNFIVPYVLMSVIFALATIIAFFELRYKKAPKIHENKPKGLLFGVKYIFKKPALIFHFINNSAFGINWGIKGMLWPLIIFGMVGKDTITGSIFATMGVVAFLLLLFIGRLVDKIGPFKSAFVSMTILGLSGIVLGLTNNIVFFWIAAAIFAIGEAINGPMQAVLLTNHVSNNHRGEVLGLDSVFDRILNTIAPFFAGFLLNYISAQSILLIFISFFWLSIFGSMYVYKQFKISRS